MRVEVGEPAQGAATRRASEDGRYSPPPIAAAVVDRGRLLRRLADPGARVILVHGPGGTGKSALVARHAQLLAARGGTVAWLRLVRADQDPIVLIHDIVSAARLRIPDFGSRVTAAMARSRRLERQVSVLTKLLIEDMAQADDLVLVLDGHVRAQPEGPLAEFLDELVVAIPEPVRLVLSLRAAPRSRVVAREIAAGAILEIGPTDLAFTRDETAGLLRRTSGPDLPDATIDRVQAATAGWPLGVRLAATLLRRDPAYDLDRLPSGPSRLVDAIATGLGGRDGSSIMQRLARIAVLDEIAIERVPADEREAVRLLIDELEGGGLLEHDPSGRAWRPQPLVAELLRSFAAASLAREDVIGLYRARAERALEDGDLDHAIEHFQRAGDHDRAARILGDHAERLLSSGEVVRLASWAGGFPRDASRLPWVLLVRGVLRRLDRDYEPALALYRAAEEGFRSANDDAGLARSLIWSGQALRYLRRPRQATASVRAGLAALGVGASIQGAWGEHLLGQCLTDIGEIEAGIEAQARADHLFALLGERRGQLMVALALARMRADLGCLDDAQRSYLAAMELQGKAADVSVLCRLQAGLAEVRARRGDVADGAQGLQTIVELARANALRLPEAAVWATLALIHAVRGDQQAFETSYRRGIDLSRPPSSDDRLLVDLHTLAAEVRAARGDAVGARDALRAAEAVLSVGDLALSAVRVAIARGAVREAEGDAASALAAYREARERARAAGARYCEAKASLLAARLQPDSEASYEVREAVRAAAAEGYRDLFLLRPDLAVWLRERVGDLRLSAEDAQRAAELISAVPADAVRAATAASGGMQLQLLGTFELRSGAARVSDRAWRTSKAKEMFVLLVTERSRPLGRDELIAALWPDADQASAVSNFHFTLHALRKALASLSPDATVARSDRGYRLATSERISRDIEVFQLLEREAQVFRREGRPDESIRLLRGALALHRGDFLAGMDAAWIAQRREAVGRELVAAMRLLAELELERAEPAAAVATCERALLREPYDERLHRLLMRAYQASGDRASAVVHYERLAETLRRELRIDPEPETAAVFERVRGGALLGVATAAKRSLIGR